MAFTACTGKQKTEASTTNNGVLTFTDTTGLAEFQKWKAYNELTSTTMYSHDEDMAVAKTVKKTAPLHKAAATHHSSTMAMNSAGQYPAKVVKKKGWSNRAKGAAIGGGSGAILGAILDKNHRVAGGVLGGVLGAGVGYVVGNEMDRKHRRY